ncbi:MAG TPA: GNAT family N-acetyltransferase [Pyrinomonadaceae bacterium]|nr:GNAT family N-acetyltransferase [Pyrinomonadaceae bacterium]
MTPKEITIRPVEPSDRDEWLRLRKLLWDHTSEADHLLEMNEIINDPESQLVLVAAEGNSLIGFLEVSIRHFAEDCETDNVGYLEGWYVEPDFRRTGIGRSLVANAEGWARDAGCMEMASDAELGNEESLSAHTQLGYEETSRLIHFRKEIR